MTGLGLFIFKGERSKSTTDLRTIFRQFVVFRVYTKLRKGKLFIYRIFSSLSSFYSKSYLFSGSSISLSCSSNLFRSSNMSSPSLFGLIDDIYKLPSISNYFLNEFIWNDGFDSHSSYFFSLYCYSYFLSLFWKPF